ncbi:hypothetical protein RO3G_01193 [Rhizopus delemar RA 99-880]|uniref:Transposase domain-containing protein n=1 Tax=Rhizopus delemar (strain RA 99-880 / ATCC MYA-4621 / FGSC 9543 / NRRL 43880) TaxID=246409 RepID=I1BJV9_RHIO9|nr:hypothetical protein RO3G_01193 [Rhizopus delemar RA 99-880]|eukprot:EIE76489.1 hypothetical protein RO3G_01193 [Rhizopus delemar RA 99-880]
MEIPTKISTARNMVNYSSASSGVSRFLVCSLCRSVYDTGSLHTRRCPFIRFANNPHRQEHPCGNSLFIGSSLKPVLEFPYNSIVETLKKFFVRPTFETEIEEWRRGHVGESVFYDIYDGRVWNSLVDSAGEPFVNKSRSLMVSLNVDWLQPSDGMHYSCGGVYLTINNLPRSSRMKVSNIILVGMIPGPGEPTDDQLQNFMRPMIAELNTLYGGMMMPTYQNRNGEIVRVALMFVKCDIPAACKVAGFMGQSAHKACNKCSTVFSRVSTGANSTKPDFSDFDDEHWILRNNTQQRQEAYAWLNATHITQQRTLQTNTGSTPKRMVEVWVDHWLLTTSDFKAMADESASIIIPSQYCKISKVGEHFINWIRYVEAVRLVTGPLITTDEIQTAHSLFKEFGKTCVQLYGKTAITPNMHMHMHLKECFLDFGPSYAFWLYGFERLNGDIKKININYKTGFETTEIGEVTNDESGLTPFDYSQFIDGPSLFNLTITGSEPLPPQALHSKINIKQHNLCIGHYELLQNYYMDTYEIPMPNTITTTIQSFKKINLLGQHYQQANNDSSSSHIQAIMNNQLRIGQISFFFSHSFNNSIHYFAFVNWYSHATQHFPTFDGTGIQVWKNQFDPVSSNSILPIYRIFNPVAICPYVDDHILTLALPRRIFM